MGLLMSTVVELHDDLLADVGSNLSVSFSSWVGSQISDGSEVPAPDFYLSQVCRYTARKRTAKNRSLAKSTSSWFIDETGNVMVGTNRLSQGAYIVFLARATSTQSSDM